MGSIILGPKILPDHLTELAGSKAGLAMSIEEICDHLSGTKYADIVLAAEVDGVRLRSEEYEDLFYRFMYRIGYTEDEYLGPSIEMARQFQRYNRDSQKLDFYMSVSAAMSHLMREGFARDESMPADPRAVIAAIKQEFGIPGAQFALETYAIIQKGIRLDPHAALFREWDDTLELNGLFTGSNKDPEKGQFIDQRYIDYLSNNTDRLGDMHWRKFEQLTAEFYEREGYKVDLGPGSNDDGVDVRIWHPDADPTESPLCIAQCKRVQDKIDKVTVKGLHADVEFEKATYGVIVTTSELSPGAKTTISARGYAIEAVERDGVMNWLKKLRTPGTGIVR
ncbi:restriction endonuclease [Burkholderia stagnalis]|uniref:restriction endonuclease n=1 Tax=Burkholderia stagnalis TaxID=1503054 RepID=UPI0007C7C20F|nr:restriction endonuclease [Burkholderia stagnalis]